MSNTTDFETAEREAQGSLEALQAQRQRLAVEAASDAEAAEELALVESEIAEAERGLERARLARAELARRDGEAQAEAAARRRGELLAEVAELGARRQKAAAGIDSALARFARALLEHQLACDAQARALSALRPRGRNDERFLADRARATSAVGNLSGAFAVALRDAGARDAFPFNVGPQLVDAKPLAQTDPGAEIAVEVAAT